MSQVEGDSLPAGETTSAVDGPQDREADKSDIRIPATNYLAKEGQLRAGPAERHLGAGPAHDGETRVIVVDDHPAYAKGLAILLESEAPEFKVVGAALSAEEALGLTKELSPDVVLMDIRMPGTDGIEATRQIREEVPNTKVIMVTVSDEPGDLYQALQAGASGFVTKDKQIHEIAESIRSVIRGHMVIPVDLAARFLQDIAEAETSHSLTPTEEAVLIGIVRGETNKQIAASLQTSERTVSRRVEELYRKLNISDRIHAAIWATQRGIGTKDGSSRHPEDQRKSKAKLLRELRSSRPSPLSHTTWASGLDPEGGTT